MNDRYLFWKEFNYPIWRIINDIEGEYDGSLYHKFGIKIRCLVHATERGLKQIERD